MLHHCMHGGTSFGCRYRFFLLHKVWSLDDGCLEALNHLIRTIFIFHFTLAFNLCHCLLCPCICRCLKWVCIRQTFIDKCFQLLVFQRHWLPIDNIFLQFLIRFCSCLFHVGQCTSIDQKSTRLNSSHVAI